MGRINHALIATLAVLGMGGQQAAAVSQSAAQTRQIVAAKNGQTTRQLEADHFGGYVGGIKRALMRDNGNPPHLWGMSKACAQMVRHRRMRRLGIGGQRI
jgi:hypothetical protein